MENLEVENQLHNKGDPNYGSYLKELEFLETEWRETRASIDRFDKISVDLRKYGFSLITFMISASSIALGATNLQNVLPALIVPFSIMILICGLFLVDRYYEVLLLSCVLRSRQLEDTSQEILATYVKSKFYLRLNLSSFLEDRVQKAEARQFSFYVYLLFIIACSFLGICSLMAHYQKIGVPLLERYWIIVFIVFSIISFLFLCIINKTIATLISKIRSEIIIDDRIIIKKLFSEDEVSHAIEDLANKINSELGDFKILTVGIGGLQFAERLIGELKRLGRTNIELISAFSESTKKDGLTDKVRIAPPERYRLERKNILIVDDLVATGLTLQKLVKICIDSDARVKTCVLLDAPNLRKVDEIQIDFRGLPPTQETGRFVGCGMDIESECRELPFIGVVKSHEPKYRTS